MPLDPAALRAFLDAAHSGPDARREIVATDGSRVVWERRDTHVRLGQFAPGGAVRAVLCEYPPTAERPVDYPPALPFVAGVAVGVSAFGAGAEATSASWTPVDDPRALADELARESLAAGWEESADGVPLARALTDTLRGAFAGAVRLATGAELAVRRLVRGDRERVIQAAGRPGHGVVTLGEHPRRSPAPQAAP